MMDGCCQIDTVGLKNLQFQSAVKLFGDFILLLFYYYYCRMFFTQVLKRQGAFSRSVTQLLWKSSLKTLFGGLPVGGPSSTCLGSIVFRQITPHSSPSPIYLSSSQLISSPPVSPSTVRAIMCQVAPSYYPHDGAASSTADNL